MAAQIRVSGNRPRAQRTYAPPKTSIAATIVAIIGWIGAGAAVFSILNSLSRQRQAEGSIRVQSQQAQGQAESALQAVRAEADAAEKKLQKEVADLDRSVLDATKEKRKAEAVIQAMERRLPALRMQISPPQSPFGQQPEPEQAAAPVPENGAPAVAPPEPFNPFGPAIPVGGGTPARPRRPVPVPVPDNAPQAPMPAPAAAGSQPEIAALISERDKLQKLYQERLDFLKLKVNAVISEGRGPQIHAFYRSASHTPYGAAALFFAGERYYEDGKLTQAAAAYKNCRENYPTSPYTEAIDQRLDQVLDKNLFRRMELEVLPIP